MNKHEMREEAVERLRDVAKHQPFGPLSADDITQALVGDEWVCSTVDEDAKTIIDLLTDDESYEGDAFAKGPRDADGILWFRGDMSDSEWGVIERTYFDGEQWMVCGHDISAPWIPADSIRHAPMRTATQREDDMVALPVDADGEVIHIGDDLCIYGERRRCTSLVLRSMDEWVVNTLNSVHKGTLSEVHHYHKPTVDEILDELEGMRGTGDYDAVVERCADLAGMLRELLKEDEDEDQA